MFCTEVSDIDELKTRIIQAVASVEQAMLVNTWNELKKRLVLLTEYGGKHVEG